MKINAYKKWDDLKSRINVEQTSNVMINVFSNDFLDVFFISNYVDDLQVAIHFNRTTSYHFNLHLNGIEIETSIHKEIDKENLSTFIINKNKSNNNIFKAFSASLFENLENSMNEQSCYKNIKKTIQQYQDYFNGNKQNKLSIIEQQGLFGELLFIYEALKNNKDIIVNWEGPNKNKHDFIFSDRSIEIKTTKNQTRKIVKISNENQLDNSLVPELYLKLYRIESIDVGLSVKDMIEKIMPMLSSQSKALFQSKLYQFGIDLLYEGPYEKFRDVESYVYLIDENFPKISKSQIDTLIFRVSYNVDLSSMEVYENELF